MPLSAGIISALPAKFSMSHRLQVLQQGIEDTFTQLRLTQGDIVVCEGPAPIVLNPHTALKVEQVRGIFETVARTRGLAVPGRINPRTVHTELLQMRGKQLSRAEVKVWARATVERLFGVNLAGITMMGSFSHGGPQDNGAECRLLRGNGSQRRKKIPQDIIDALLIGCVAVSRVQLGKKSQLSLEAVFESKPQRRYAIRSGGRRGVCWTERDVKKLLGF